MSPSASKAFTLKQEPVALKRAPIKEPPLTKATKWQTKEGVHVFPKRQFGLSIDLRMLVHDVHLYSRLRLEVNSTHRTSSANSLSQWLECGPTAGRGNLQNAIQQMLQRACARKLWCLELRAPSRVILNGANLPR